MKYVKVGGFVWALIYFVIGILSSFTLNHVDFWTSLALVLNLFLFPLPIAIIAVWSQRVAGTSLLLCFAVNLLVTGVALGSRPSMSIADKGTSVAHIAVYSIPHLTYATFYILTGRTVKG